MKKKHHKVKVLSLVLGSALTALAAASASAVGSPTIVLPDYSKPLLTPESQATTAWTNVVPNALASYYTYVPYSNADAVKLGFPATCGNLGLQTPADQNSTEDCYTITTKSFKQQLALPGIFGGGAGLLDETGVPLGVATRAYGYGSGGMNWTPPGATVAVTGNAPPPFANGTFSTTGIWHFPGPTLKGTKGRPMRIQWMNELPNEMPDGFDPTVDCGTNAPDCYPYNRIVTHVHGAHVPDDSDGYAQAWYTPGFALTGPGWLSSKHGPEGTYRYPMDQEASTIWYHDHAMGVTHNNTQMGLAGFFPITDAEEQALIAANILPIGDYDLGFALQDRNFDTTGQFAMPDYPVYDLNSPGCTLTSDGLADPATCKRLDWMKAEDGHLIPYDSDSPLLQNANNEDAPFPAASTTLEYFGNMPVVNGVTYGKYDVEPRVYRMRFIGGTDSRTWVMKLVRRDTGAVIPFWQVASEQGLLNNPVSRDSMDLLPGERLDVLVDLTGIPVGTKIAMRNIGPDGPYEGPDSLLDPAFQPSLDIPEIMEFNVITLTSADNIVTPSAATSLRTPIVPLVATPGTPIRNVSLEEMTDELGRTMPTIDGRGFKEVGVPATEIVKLNDTEEWAIINNTVDAHPIHLHLVAFQVINRQAFDPTSFVSAVTDVATQTFTQAQYANAPGSTPIPPEAWEAGWKDTIDAPPGMVTRVRAKFDIAGEKYVWHCHILSHEEHDMMRPLVVRDPCQGAVCNGYSYFFPSIKDNDAIGWENYLTVQAKEGVPMDVTIRVHDMEGVLKGTYIYSNTNPAANEPAIAPNARVALRPSWIVGTMAVPAAIEGSMVVETSVPAIASTNCIANFYKGFSIYEAPKTRSEHNFPKAFDGPDNYQVYLLVQNIHEAPRNVTVKLFGKTATDPGHGATRTVNIPAHGTLKIRPSEIAPLDPVTGMPINFNGSVVVYSNLAAPEDGLGPPIPAMCRYEAGQEAIAIYESTVPQPALSFPVIKDGRFGGPLDYQNFVSIVNPSTSVDAVITDILYNQAGIEEGRLTNDLIPPGGKKTWRPSWIKGTMTAPMDFAGSIGITSNIPVVGQTNTIYPGSNIYGAEAFDLFESAIPNPALFFPKAFDNLLGSGIGATHLTDNFVYVYNPDGTAKNITIELYNNDGTLNRTTKATILPHATHGFRPKDLSTDGTGAFRGSIRVMEGAGLPITGAIKYEIHKTTDPASGIEAMSIYRSMGQ